MSKPEENHLHHSLKEMAPHLAVIATNMTGKILIFNEGAKKLLGFSPEEIIDQTIPIIDLEKTLLSIQTENLTSIQVSLKHKNGKLIPLTLTVSLITENQTENQDEANSYYLFIASPSSTPDKFEFSKMPNSEELIRVLEIEIRRMGRQKEPLSLINIDIDGYQSYEKHYGAKATLDCLTQIAAILNSRVQRAGDFIAYMGGDEFMVVLPHTDRSGAVKMAEYMRLLVAGLELPNQSKPSGIVTISLGISHIIPDENTTAQDLLDSAAKQLERAKTEGRNCSRVDCLS